MPISRQLIREVRALDPYDLRRLQMLIRGLLPDDPQPSLPDETATRPGRVTFRQQMVRCGKKSCARCPHGPYWYAYWRESGRTRSRYIGKELPSDPGDAGKSASPPREPG